jgi:hypothetical protein
VTHGVVSTVFAIARREDGLRAAHASAFSMSAWVRVIRGVWPPCRISQEAISGHMTALAIPA